MSTTTAISKSPTTQRTRQRPGLACEECRRRKLRCNGKRPKCGVCEETGVDCIVTAAQPRGPKRGYNKTLQARIAALEKCLRERHDPGEGDTAIDKTTSATANDSTPDQVWTDLSPAMLTIVDDPLNTFVTTPLPSETAPIPMLSINSTLESLAPSSLSSWDTDMKAFSTPSDHSQAFSPTLPITPVSQLQADRDELFFDRMYPSMPILSQHRYNLWSRSPSKTAAQSCLQQAMWSVASCVSPQYQDESRAFYREARKGLETGESDSANEHALDLECIQAWLILAIYELLQVDYRKGWLTAGHAFTLIKLSRTSEVDMSRQSSLDDWGETEERRRTFWLAYCLDRFISTRKGYSLTLNDQIAVRLPAPELNFQADQPITMPFLSEHSVTVNELTQIPADPFTDCVLIASILGRGLSHRNQSMMENLHSESNNDFWNRHQWLNTVLAARVERMQIRYSPVARTTNPTLLFANMMAQSMTIYLHQVLEGVSLRTDQERQTAASNRRAALAATQEIVRLTHLLTHISYNKVHPMSPIPLSICADFLVAKEDADVPSRESLAFIRSACRGLHLSTTLDSGVLQGPRHDMDTLSSATPYDSRTSLETSIFVQ